MAFPMIVPSPLSSVRVGIGGAMVLLAGLFLASDLRPAQELSLLAHFPIIDDADAHMRAARLAEIDADRHDLISGWVVRDGQSTNIACEAAPEHAYADFNGTFVVRHRYGQPKTVLCGDGDRLIVADGSAMLPLLTSSLSRIYENMPGYGDPGFRISLDIVQAATGILPPVEAKAVSEGATYLLTTPVTRCPDGKGWPVEITSCADGRITVRAR